jgi:hypothetical protein
LKQEFDLIFLGQIEEGPAMAQQNSWALNRTANALKLKIFLDTSSYDCLVKCIYSDALSRAAINAAGTLGNTRVVECDDIEARDLLFCAKSHCPGAVDKIAGAIRAAGLTP